MNNESDAAHMVRLMVIRAGVWTHIGQCPLVLPGEQVGHLVQNSPAPLSGFGELRLVDFIGLRCILCHTCENHNTL